MVRARVGLGRLGARPVRWSVMLALGVLALVGAAQSALAETRVALVIGNARYQHTTPLTNPENDARDIASALTAAGFQVLEAFDVEKRRFDTVLRAWIDAIAKADVALLYYAGHGIQVGQQSFLVPVDAKLDKERDLEFEAVKVEFVLRQMEIDRAGRTNIVILDACRDNPLAKGLSRSMGTRSINVGRGLAATKAGQGMFIAYATQPGNVALDGGEGARNSPFARALVKEMLVKGRNINGTMTAVRRSVLAATSGEQVPWEESSLTQDFYFLAGAPGATAPPVAPKQSEEIAALRKQIEDLQKAQRAAEEQRKREAAATPGLLMLAELRARATTLEAQAKDLQRRLLEERRNEGRATTPEERRRLQQISIATQMDMTRRFQELQRLRTQIAALEVPPAPPIPPAADAPRLPPVPPVTPKATTPKVSPDFTLSENVGLLGVEIDTAFRAPSPVACRVACERQPGCVGFQHGRKVPVMGQCTLFSRIDARREDSQWRSGVRTAPAAPADAPAAEPAPPAPPQRTHRGFQVFAQSILIGTAIKSTRADSIDSCVVACLNTAACAGLNFAEVARSTSRSEPNCHLLSGLTRHLSDTNWQSARRAAVKAEPAGCRRLGPPLPSAIPLQAGLKLCDGTGRHEARVEDILDRAVRFKVVGGRDFACKPGDVCQFDWPGAPSPYFQVQIREGAGSAPATASIIPRQR